MASTAFEECSKRLNVTLENKNKELERLKKSQQSDEIVTSLGDSRWTSADRTVKEIYSDIVAPVTKPELFNPYSTLTLLLEAITFYDGKIKFKCNFIKFLRRGRYWNHYSRGSCGSQPHQYCLPSSSIVSQRG